MLSYYEMEDEGDEKKTLEVEPDLRQMAQQVQNLFKVKKNYYKMNFTGDQLMAITKAIIELNDSQEGSEFHKKTYVEG